MLMSFKEWKKWFTSLNWGVRWFILLVLLRPVIDNFYYLKEISPFFSPLYIVGVLTPVFSIYSFFVLKKPNYSKIDVYVSWFSVIVLLSCGAIFLNNGINFDSMEVVIKLSFMPYFFFFCRRLIRSKQDLHGVFQTFLYSAIVVFGIFMYELIFHPINVAFSRGLERISGSYADVMNYAIYMVCSFLITGYMYFEKEKEYSARKRISWIVFVALMSFVMLLKINHTASFAVVGTILLLFVLHSIRANIGLGLFLGIAIGGVVYLAAKDLIEDTVMTLIQTDIKVYEGEKDSQYALHGRVGRWENYLEVFFESNSVSQFLGVPMTVEEPYQYITKGAHNDFVRTLMFTGYLGLFFYLLILGNVFLRVQKYNTPMHFLGYGSVASLFLYSISTTPSLYPVYMYILYPIFCMLALPQSVMDESKQKKLN